MFTGIIEGLGRVEAVDTQGTNRTYWISCPFTSEMGVDESLSHDGVCLTIIGHNEQGCYGVTAIDETLQRTSLQQWQVGTWVNLERAMSASGRFDGHIVQGHVDATGVLEQVEDRDGSWLLRFGFPPEHGTLMVEKGSCTINGISLTIFDIGPASFHVAIIPYTWTHTNLSQLIPGQLINLEFDIVGKYIAKILSLRN